MPLERGRRALLASFCAPPTATPPTIAPSAPLTMRPRIDPFDADEVSLPGVVGRPEDARFAVEDARLAVEPEARLAVDDERLVEPDARLLEGEEAAAALRGFAALLAAPVDLPLEEEDRFDAARPEPEEDRDRLLEPPVVAISVHLFRLLV